MVKKLVGVKILEYLEYLENRRYDIDNNFYMAFNLDQCDSLGPLDPYVRAETITMVGSSIGRKLFKHRKLERL
jgi:hypothetical protein